MIRTEKNIALFLAASAVGALALVACQEVAGGVLARVLDLPEGALFGGLGLRRFSVFKLGLFLAVVPWVLHELGGELPRRIGVGLFASAVFAWATTELVFKDGQLAATYALLGAGATFATAFTGWRRWAAAGALGLVVAATLLAGEGQSLADGRNFGTAVVLGLAFCAPAIAAVAFAPEAVARVEAFVASRRHG